MEHGRLSHLRSAWLVSLVVVLSACVASEDRKPDSADLRNPWSLATIPNDPALAAGQRVFEFCASCHLADGSGRADGTIPRLAGQRASILEGRLRGLRDGSIDLPVMTPFARALSDTEIRQVSAYLASLPTPESPKLDASGKSASAERERGALLYGAFCLGCHAADALGQPALNAPRLCGQHEAYLLRRLDETTSPNPRSLDPAMKAIVAILPPEDLRAISAHLSRRECGG